MGDVPTTHAGVPADGTAIEPTLVLTFFGHGNGGTQRRAIPRGGLLLGREEVVFDDAFDDFRMAPRHAEVIEPGVLGSASGGVFERRRRLGG